MINGLFDWFERSLDLSKIDHPSHGVVDWSADMDFNPEAMAVETTAFVSCRDVGQAMRSLDREFLENFHGHLLRNP